MNAPSLDGEQLRSIFDLAPVGIAISDGGGTFIHANRAFQKMTGYDLDELREMTSSGISHPDDAMADLVAQRDLLAGKMDWLRLEKRLIHKTGRMVWCRADVSIVRQPDGAVRHGITMFQDITEQKQAEERLRRSDERCRLHFETGHDVLFSVDRDMRILTASPSVESVLGFTSDELVGKTAVELGIVAPGCIAQAREELAAVMAGKRVDLSPYELVSRSGEVKCCEVSGSPIHEDGKVVGALVVVRDVSERRAMENALRESQRAMATLLSNVPGLAYRCRNDKDWTMELLSEGCLALTGYCRKDFLEHRGICYADIIHPDDRDKVWDDVQEALAEKKPFKLTYRIRTKAGEEKWVWEQGRGIYSPGGELLALEGLIIDVTARVRAERQLHQSEARLRTAMESLPFDFFVLAEDGRYVMQNATCREHWGDVVGKRPDDVAPDAETLALWQSNNRRAFAGEVVSGEAELGRAGAHVHNIIAPIRDGDEVRGILGINIDITDRKRAEQALADSEARLSSIIDQSPVSTWILDAEGTLIRQNEACRRLLGIDSDEQTVGRFNIFQDRHAIQQGHAEAIRAVFTEGKTAHLIADYNVSQAGCVNVPYGIRRLLAVTIFPVKDADGNVIYAVGQHEDITELREKEEQLRQAHKMEAIGNLVGSIAHDFNNQLTVVKGYCDLLLGSTPPDDACYEPVEQIGRAARRAAALTSQLLAYSRKQVLHPETVDINMLLEELADPIRKMIGDRIELTIVPSAGPATVRADVVQLQQAITNVVLNARDAMADGGTLTMATANSDLCADPAAGPGENPPCHCVVLSVTDTGMGMDDETRSHIFDPFFTTKPLGQGTGLGLSMAYGFVTQSGGQIEVASQLGKGSTFRICLPQVSAEPIEQDDATAATH